MGQIVTQSQIVIKVLSQKEYPIQVQLTVGGNRIEYQGKVTKKTAEITTFKIHINTVISTRGAKYSGWKIRNYYL